MSKKVDFFDYQETLIQALQDQGNDLVSLSWGYGNDQVRVRISDLQLVKYTNGKGANVAQWVNTRKNSNGLVMRTDTYPARGVRLVGWSRTGNLRALVKGSSCNLLADAIERSMSLQFNSADHVSAWGYKSGFDLATPTTPAEFIFDNQETAKFLPGNKPALVDKASGVDYLGNYQEMKIGRAVRYVLDCVGIEATDQELEKIVNEIKAVNAPLNIQYTQDLEWLYNREDVAENSGTLLDSCMRNKGHFYGALQSSGNVRAWYWENEAGELLGRALEWTTIRGTKVLDRIYTSDHLIQRVKKEAQAQGVIHKQFQSYAERFDFVKPNGENETATYKIEVGDLLGAIYDEEVPYMDTFCFYSWSDDEGGFITNKRDLVEFDGSQAYELRNTGGDADQIWG